MKATAIGAAMLLAVATPAHAHRLDEYLQAAMISVAKGRIQLQLRLTPGVAVFPRLRTLIDANLDGTISEAEQRSYADLVTRDLSVTVDGDRQPLRLTGLKFPAIAEMQEGRGEMELDFEVLVPDGGAEHGLSFENRHQAAISAYLANAVRPSDPSLEITRQSRSADQSTYQMDYADFSAPSGTASRAWQWVLLSLLFIAVLAYVMVVRPPSVAAPATAATRRA